MQFELSEIKQLIDQGKYKQAEKVISLTLGADLDFNRKELLLLRGRVRLLTGRIGELISDISYLSNTNPSWLQEPSFIELVADANLAQFENANLGFRDTVSLQTAINLYKRLMDEFTNYENRGWVCFQLARTHLIQNKVGLAIEYFSTALSSRSTVKNLPALCYERLAFIAFYELRNFDEALGYINQALKSDSDDPRELDWRIQAQLLRARILHLLGCNWDSYNTLDNVIHSISEQQTDSTAALAEALLASAEITSDIDGLEHKTIHYLHHFMRIAKRPVGVDVTWSRVYELIGYSCFALNLFSEAEIALKTSLEFNPDHPWFSNISFLIARCYYNQSDFSRVIISIRSLQQRGIEDDPMLDQSLLYGMLGNALFATKHYGEAAEAYGNALETVATTTRVSKDLESYQSLALELM
jgi:tetratricopeptide (TPR) repeat protein